MTQDDDPLDMDGDGKFTDIDLFLLDEEQKQRNHGGNKNMGCCVVFLALGTSAILSIWAITRIT